MRIVQRAAVLARRAIKA